MDKVVVRKFRTTAADDKNYQVSILGFLVF